MMKKSGEYSLWRRLCRFARYWYLKMMRTAGSPAYIGRGAAAGVFVCFFFPIGFQTIPALALAFLVKGAKIPAVLFTWLSNYATAVVVYPVQCYVGGYLTFNPISYPEMAGRLKTALQGGGDWNFSALFQLGWELAAAFLAGGLLFGAVAAVPGYFLALKLAREFQARRRAKRKRCRAPSVVVG